MEDSSLLTAPSSILDVLGASQLQHLKILTAYLRLLPEDGSEPPLQDAGNTF
jgi:hypothetical protein